jgi:hypothetical protein
MYHQAQTEIESRLYANQLVDLKSKQLGLVGFSIEKKPTQEELEFRAKYPEYTKAIHYLRNNEDQLDKTFLFNILTSCLCYMDENSIKTINIIWLK